MSKVLQREKSKPFRVCCPFTYNMRVELKMQQVSPPKYLTILFFVFIIVSGCKENPSVHPVRKNIVETVYASGTIIPTNEYTVYSLANGTIVEKKATEGDSVSKGSVLYLVRNDAVKARAEAAEQAYQTSVGNLGANSPIIADLKLTMQNAEAKFHNDSLEYIRAKSLLESNAIAKSQFDQISNAYTISRNQRQSAEERYHSALRDLKLAASNSKSQLATARNDLDNYSIASDASGFVFQTLKEEGEAVRVGEPVALLGEKDRRTIKLAVDQQDIDKIRNGQKVLLKTDITGSKIYEAKVVKVYWVMNPADQTFRVDAEFTGEAPTGFVHGSVEANIVIQKKENALIIPRTYLLGGDSVLTHFSGKDVRVAVKPGILTLDDAEIDSGIDEKTEIVLPSQK
jgi:multidrug efflux pump subunit AcrA (membrane-fusion protein)